MVSVYGILGEASALNVQDTLKVLKTRKVLRPHVEEWKAFYRDVQEKAQQWESMGEEEKAQLNRMVESELGREIEVELEKLSEEGVASIISATGCKVREAELLAAMAE